MVLLFPDAALGDDSAAWLSGVRGAGAVEDTPATLQLPAGWLKSFDAMREETARTKLEQAACLEHRGEFLVTAVISGKETMVKRQQACRGPGSVHTHPHDVPSGRLPLPDEFLFSAHDLRIIGIAADHVTVLVRKDGLDRVLRTAAYRPGADSRFLQKLLLGCWLMHLGPGDSTQLSHGCIALGLARIGLAYYTGTSDGQLSKVAPAPPAFIDPATLELLESSPYYQNPLIVSFAKAVLKGAGRYPAPITGEFDDALATALLVALDLRERPAELGGEALVELVRRFACGSIRQALGRSCRDQFADIGRTFERRRVLRATATFRAGAGVVQLEAVEVVGVGQSQPIATALHPRLVERFDTRRAARYVLTEKDGERTAIRIRYANGNRFEGYADERGVPNVATEYVTADWIYAGGIGERFQFQGEGRLRMRTPSQDGWVFECVFKRARCVSGTLTKPGDEVFEVAHPGERRGIARIVRRIK
ncbi:MAG: hypothetical protein ACT4P4_22730 [Betaproteobacteria bacterium]